MRAPTQATTARRQTLGLTRRGWLTVAAGGAALLAAPLWLPRVHAASGFEALDLDWNDVRRQRPVPARLYLPRAAAPEAKVPLVVFSHGIGSTRERYRWIGQYLAEQGYACLHPQHVGSDRQVWAGNPLAVLARLQGAATETEALARVADVRFVLDELLSSALGPRLDERRIVLAGHSYGANTTLLAAGATVMRDGRPVVQRDERARAAIAISAPPFYREGDPRRIVGGIELPSLHVTATEDVIRIPGYYSGADDRLELFRAIGGTHAPHGPRKWLAMFEGGSHSIFTDRPGTGGALLNPQVKEATRALVVAFLRAVLDEDETPMRAWPQQFAALLARFEAA